LFKYSVVDVKCTDKLGRTFIVEMQMEWSANFRNRILFNAAQAYVKQLKNAGDYRELQPVFALTLVNDVFDHDTSEYYHHFQIVNIQNTNELLKGLQFVFIELPKFKPAGTNGVRHPTWHKSR
jgi:predicted transposase/invertase (TIGR01784 family)